MPKITRTKTKENCPDCQQGSLTKILEEWEAFPESGVQYVERRECTCGYTAVLRDDMNLIETEKAKGLYAHLATA